MTNQYYLDLYRKKTADLENRQLYMIALLNGGAIILEGDSNKNLDVLLDTFLSRRGMYRPKEYTGYFMKRGRSVPAHEYLTEFSEWLVQTKGFRYADTKTMWI